MRRAAQAAPAVFSSAVRASPVRGRERALGPVVVALLAAPALGLRLRVVVRHVVVRRGVAVGACLLACLLAAKRCFDGFCSVSDQCLGASVDLEPRFFKFSVILNLLR